MQIYFKNWSRIREISQKGVTPIPEDSKPFLQYVGRIQFENYFQLLNFEKYIYSDKQFKYSNISDYNKRLIPEFLSLTMANLIFNEIIELDIRMVLEQYLIAIMSNMDYTNIADIRQIHDLHFDNNISTLIYVIGSCPKTFNDDDYVQIMTERIKCAQYLHKELINVSKIPLIKVFTRTSPTNIDEIIEYDNGRVQKLQCILDESIDSASSKLTKFNIDKIFNHIDTERNLASEKYKYNLILVGSSYQVTKIAHEVEKHFYEKDQKRTPKSITIVGNENFFEYFVNRGWFKSSCQDQKNELRYIKKMSSLLFDLYLHTLDKNKNK